MTDKQFEAPITIDVGNRSAGAEPFGLTGITDIEFDPLVIAAAKQTIGFAQIIEKKLRIAVVVEICRNHGADAAGVGEGWWCNIVKCAVAASYPQAMRPFPVAIGNVELAVVVGIKYRHAPPMLLTIGARRLRPAERDVKLTKVPEWTSCG